ncbi:MAG TPA: DUF885 domain-containing protein [Trebonia sp.]|jgi:uncharacterized protein (DUF885 family)|nr:DUF885 domain-containing protein [Trebonia sp.]
MRSDREMSPVFSLCDAYLTEWAALDPVSAGMRGLSASFGAATDYSPEGYAARAGLIGETLSELSALAVNDDADRLAALLLRERLETQAAWHATGEPLRELRSPFGRIASLRDSVDLLPKDSEQAWRNIAARLAAIPLMFGSWRASLDEGLRQGLPAARRQALGAAAQAERYAELRTHDAVLAAYGDGPLAGELADAAAAAYRGYLTVARYLREEYAPRAAEADAVGAERYAVNARLSLGADLDAREAYEWGWAELARIEAELAAEASRVKPGASVDEASEILDETEFVEGEDAYQAWLQDRHDEAVARLDGVVFDIPAQLRVIEAVLARGSASGAAYYTAPSEDFTRPGRTWWPLGGRESFSTWNELTVVFHEGVPGHHLQAGAASLANLSRFARSTFISGHGEGWALYAERLADELGWFESRRGSRLGMLAGSATRAARVVIDIGVHLDLPLPDGSRWTFEKACEVLRDRGRAEGYRVVPEVTRYFGWPGQAPSYKLGERAWLAAREAASQRPGFDLKRWHTASLSLGPLGLESLTAELARLGG